VSARGRVRLRVRVTVRMRLRVRARVPVRVCVRRRVCTCVRARACACHAPRARHTPCALMTVARGGRPAVEDSGALPVLRAARCRVGALGCSIRVALASFNLPGLTVSWAHFWGSTSGPSLGGRRAVALPWATERRPPESGPEVGPGIGAAIRPGSAHAGGQATFHAERVCERCGCSSSAGAVRCWWLGPRQRQAVGGRTGEYGCVVGPWSASSGSGRNRGRDEWRAFQRCVALPAGVQARSIAEPAWFADTYASATGGQTDALGSLILARSAQASVHATAVFQDVEPKVEEIWQARAPRTHLRTPSGDASQRPNGEQAWPASKTQKVSAAALSET
jgi:hypothetical protein